MDLPMSGSLNVTVNKIDPSIETSSARRTIMTASGKKIVLKGVRYAMDDRGSSLVVLSWPESVPIPTFKAEAEYHDIRVHGKMVTQPRNTACYGVSYKYSGVAHELEAETPADIQRIMDYTKSMYASRLKGAEISTMCLANRYTTGYHYISEHSDDEDQFSAIRDVVCWVKYTGPGLRRVFFRNKTTKGIVLEIAMGDGVYIMEGDHFQESFKHGIPKEYPTLFDKHIFPALPEDVSAAGKYEAADWAASHPSKVRPLLSAANKKKYDLWRTERCSYTIRFFSSR
jgi:hypothetical protein